MSRKYQSPFKYPSAEECPSFFDHTPHPSGYIQHHAWMQKMSRTHKQVRCTRCGFWAIWEPKVSTLVPHDDRSPEK